MGRIIPYMMENKKMYETTNQINAWKGENETTWGCP
jgi:hypothetical protein